MFLGAELDTIGADSHRLSANSQESLIDAQQKVRDPAPPAEDHILDFSYLFSSPGSHIFTEQPFFERERLDTPTLSGSLRLSACRESEQKDQREQ
jgi:hypothetical protein